MPSYFYVKEGGTADPDSALGKTATPRAGSFAAMGAANYYDSLISVTLRTTRPVAGDVIVVSHLHAKVYASPVNLAIANVQIISVDDSNCDQYKPGASETSDAFNSDMSMNEGTSGAQNVGYTINGVSFHCPTGLIAWGDVNIEGLNGRFFDSNFSVSNNHYFTLNKDDGPLVLEFTRCSFNSISASSGDFFFTSLGNPFPSFRSCEFFADAGVTKLLSTSFTNGFDAVFEDCDFSGFAAAAMEPTGWVTIGTNASSREDVQFYNCKLPSGISQLFSPHPWFHPLTQLKAGVYGCTNPFDSNNHDARYYMQEINVAGLVETDIAEYLNASYDNISFSLQVSTSSDCTLSSPFDFKLGVIPAFDMTAGGTIIVELIAADATLTDSDVWLEVSAPDETDQVLGVESSTRGAERFPSKSGVGTALTSSDASWNVGTGTKYQIPVTIPAQPAGTPSGTLKVRVYVGKASTDINFDPAITVS